MLNDTKYSLAVRFWVARRQKEEVTVIDYGPHHGLGRIPLRIGAEPGVIHTQEYVVNNYVQGTMVVDLIDPATKELVWRTFVRQKIEDRAKAYVEAKKNLYKAMSILPPSAEEKEKMRKSRAKLEAKYK